MSLGCLTSVAIYLTDYIWHGHGALNAADAPISLRLFCSCLPAGVSMKTQASRGCASSRAKGRVFPSNSARTASPASARSFAGKGRARSDMRPTKVVKTTCTLEQRDDDIKR